MPYRGSRKHVLDWVTQPGFRAELNSMVAGSGVIIGLNDRYMPTGFSEAGAVEAQLHRFGPAALPSAIDWSELNRWWLAAPHGANTPNWDLAATAALNGKPALVLVEAKANVPELSADGKVRPVGKDGAPASANSWRNLSGLRRRLQKPKARSMKLNRAGRSVAMCATSYPTGSPSLGSWLHLAFRRCSFISASPATPGFSMLVRCSPQ